MGIRRILRATLAVLLLGPCYVYPQEASRQALYEDAVRAYDGGDVQRAIKLYEELLRKAPGSVQARTNLGVALAHEGRYEDAVVQYKEALKVDAGNPTVHLDLALAWYKEAVFRKAAAELEDLHRKQAENQQVLYLLTD